MTQEGSWDTWKDIDEAAEIEAAQQAARRIASAAIVAMPMKFGHPHFAEWKARVEEQPYMGA